MKRITILILTLILAITLTTPALAAGTQPLANKTGLFSLVGKITAIDPATQTVTVSVLRGNILVKPYLGKTLDIKTTATTRFLFTDGVTTKVIKFEDLKVGNPVSINGKLANSVWTATRVTVGAKLSCLLP